MESVYKSNFDKNSKMWKFYFEKKSEKNKEIHCWMFKIPRTSENPLFAIDLDVFLC